jgi:hypothetical protein
MIDIVPKIGSQLVYVNERLRPHAIQPRTDGLSKQKVEVIDEILVGVAVFCGFVDPEERLGGFVRSLEHILPIRGCVLAVDLTDKRAHRGAELRDTAGYSALYNHRGIKNVSQFWCNPEKLPEQYFLARFHSALHVRANRALECDVVAVGCTLAHFDPFRELRHEGFKDSAGHETQLRKFDSEDQAVKRGNLLKPL